MLDAIVQTLQTQLNAGKFNMIAADTVKKCSQLDRSSLELILRKDYPEDHVLSSEFIGMTSTGHFIYNISFPDPGDSRNILPGRVFVWQDKDGDLIADY